MSTHRHAGDAGLLPPIAGPTRRRTHPRRRSGGGRQLGSSGRARVSEMPPARCPDPSRGLLAVRSPRDQRPRPAEIGARERRECTATGRTSGPHERGLSFVRPGCRWPSPDLLEGPLRVRGVRRDAHPTGPGDAGLGADRTGCSLSPPGRRAVGADLELTPRSTLLVVIVGGICMKAVVYHGPKHVSVDQVGDPKIEQPTDAIIRITTTNICGSDLHMYEGRTAVEEGKILGHENMGVVEEVGAGRRPVQGRRPGVGAVQHRLRHLPQLPAGLDVVLHPDESHRGRGRRGLRLREHGPLRRRPGRAAARAVRGLQPARAARRATSSRTTSPCCPTSSRPAGTAPCCPGCSPGTVSRSSAPARSGCSPPTAR